MKFVGPLTSGIAGRHCNCIAIREDFISPLVNGFRCNIFTDLVIDLTNSAHFFEIQLVFDGPTDGETDGHTLILI